MQQVNEFDVVIAGAGPAGCAAAMCLARAGVQVALLDKATFPRDKICGDALSLDVINQLPLLNSTLANTFKDFSGKVPSKGVKLFSPAGHYLDIPFIYKGQKSSGFICPRLDFDNLLFRELRQYPFIHIFEDCTIQEIERNKEKVLLRTSKGKFSGKMLVGADGAQSVVARQLAHTCLERQHHSAGLRMYFEGVNNFHPDNYIELYFLKDILPGYLWVFPLPGNKANVGIGMLSSVISEKQVNLREILQHLLGTHPLLQDRFKRAKPLEKAKGFGLPLGSKKRKISGERFVLTGDAASLIDPFSGEGIGNAIRSGRIAAQHIITCLEKDNFSADFNQAYDKEVYRRMWKELRISRNLQRLCTYPWLFNFVVRKAAGNQVLQQFFTDALADVDKKRLLLKPSFYYRLLTNKS